MQHKIRVDASRGRHFTIASTLSGAVALHRTAQAGRNHVIHLDAADVLPVFEAIATLFEAQRANVGNENND